MSALAIFLKDMGFDVRGSDESVGDGTALLQENGICVDFDVNEEEIAKSDAIVFSSAIKPDDPRVTLAKKHKKPLFSRGELLGFVSRQYEKVIAVAGSHGKTTTTALVYEILKVAGENPTLHLGGFRLADHKNFVLGDKKFFVTEACEYHNNFLNLFPHISVVTNIEKEHMDFFKTFSNQVKSFEQFKSQSEVVIDSFQGVRAEKVRHDKLGGLMFRLVDGEMSMNVHMHLCEEINTQNCIYAYLVAKRLNIPPCVVKCAFERFRGVKTRFERMNCSRFSVVICDYAHHPTELSKAIFTAKKIFKKRKLVTVFQPHTFSRTQSLLHEFVSVFESLPCPVFFKTYSARENESDGVSAKTLSEIVKKRNKNAQYFEDFASLSAFLENFQKDEVAILFLGAGDLPSILHKKNFVT